MRLARTLRVQWLVHSSWPGSLQKLAVAAAASSKQQSRRVLVPCRRVCRREGGAICMEEKEDWQRLWDLNGTRESQVMRDPTLPTSRQNAV